MEKKKQPFSVKLIYWLTQIAFWFFVVVAVGAIGLNIALHTGVLANDLQLHVGLPVEVSYTGEGLLQIAGIEQEVRYVESIGKLHLVNTNPIFAKWFGGVMLLAIAIMLYIFISIRRFVGNIYRGYVFERFNIQMLKNIAYGLLALWLFQLIYARIFFDEIARKIDFRNLSISEEFNYYPDLLVAALVLWVLSHLFMTGTKLREEQELTV